MPLAVQVLARFYSLGSPLVPLSSVHANQEHRADTRSLSAEGRGTQPMTVGPSKPSWARQQQGQQQVLQTAGNLRAEGDTIEAEMQVKPLSGRQARSGKGDEQAGSGLDGDQEMGTVPGANRKAQVGLVGVPCSGQGGEQGTGTRWELCQNAC